MNTNRIKIMIFEPYLFKIYGNTRYLITIYRYIDRSRFDPILVSPVPTGFFSYIKNLGGRCVLLPAPDSLQRYGGTIPRSGLGRRSRILLDLITYNFKLFNFIKQEGIELIQCHSLRSLLMVALATKLARKPIFWYIKGVLSNPLLDRLAFFIADRISFLSETTKNAYYPKLIMHYRDKINIIKIAVDLQKLTEIANCATGELRKELAIADDRVNLVFIGGISPPKGVDILLQAMVEVQEKISEVALYLVGDHGVEEYRFFRPELEEFVRKQKLTNIHFTGWRQDAREILSLMDVMVMPSLSEGVPRSIVEAMALGKPVVATRVGGTVDLVQEGLTGFLVEPGDSHALAQAMIKLAQDQGLRKRFGEKAREIACREYSVRDSIAGLEDIYLELLGKKVPPEAALAHGVVETL